MMLERAGVYWRQLGTGLCFVLFGIGGLVLGFCVFPLMRLAVRDPAARAAISKAIVRSAFRAFVALLRLLGVLSVEVIGRQKLQRPGLLVVSNHPSLLDVVLLMSLMPRADCVVKPALARNPFTRGPIRAAAFQCNDAPERLVDDCISSIRSGNSLIIFPEGTRTPASGTVRLQRGAAAISVRGSLCVTPVRIACTPPTLRKGDKWYEVPARRPHFRIHIGDDIEAQPGNDRPARATRRFNGFLTEYFSRTASMQRPDHALNTIGGAA